MAVASKLLHPLSLTRALLGGFVFGRCNQSGNGGAKAVGKLEQGVQARVSQRSAPAALDGSGDASARRDLFAGEALAAPTDWHI